MNDTSLPLPSASDPRKKTRPRAKVGVKKGFGLHDWSRLVKSARDLAQRKGQPLRRISRAEIGEHSDVHDCWVSLRGKVYNLTPYLHYHPGGVDILKPCFGKDASALFDKYHRWVNVDGLIGPLLIGYLEEEKPRNKGNTLSRSIVPPVLSQHGSTKATPKAKNEFPVPAPRPPKAIPSLLPSGDEEEVDDENPWEGKI